MKLRVSFVSLITLLSLTLFSVVLAIARTGEAAATTSPSTLAAHALSPGQTQEPVSQSARAPSLTAARDHLAAPAAYTQIRAIDNGGIVAPGDGLLPQMPTGITVAGPWVVNSNVAAFYTATLGGIFPGLPMTLTWEATGHQLVSHLVQGPTSRMSFTWPLTGSAWVTATARNALGTISASQRVAIVEGQLIRLEPFRPATIDLDDQGETATLSVPTASVTATTTLVYQPLETAGAANLLFAGRAFRLSAYREGQWLPTLSFEQPLSLTLAYEEEAVAKINETELALLLYQSEQWFSPVCGTYRRNLEANRLTAGICSTGEYALFGPIRSWLQFLPLMIRSEGRR